MFEQSLLSPSTMMVRSRRRSRALIVSVFTQVVVCACVLLIPLLQPQRLPAAQAAVMVAVLPAQPEPPPVRPLPRQPMPLPSRTSSALTAPEPQPLLHVRASGMVSLAATSLPSDAPPMLALGGGMSKSFTTALGPGALTGTGTGTGIHAIARAPAVAPAAGPAPTPRISNGIIRGLLIAPIRPVYPAIARAAGVEGTVVLTATIDKSGRIVNLAVAEGPTMLRASAIEAVSTARYRPYLLNGQPTEVMTTISVIFHLGGS